MDVAREERVRQGWPLASARRRIDDDDYGYCLGCGEDIAEARLKIDPAVTCVSIVRGTPAIGHARPITVDIAQIIAGIMSCYQTSHHLFSGWRRHIHHLAKPRDDNIQPAFSANTDIMTAGSNQS